MHKKRIGAIRNKAKKPCKKASKDFGHIIKLCACQYPRFCYFCINAKDVLNKKFAVFCTDTKWYFCTETKQKFDAKTCGNLWKYFKIFFFIYIRKKMWKSYKTYPISRCSTTRRIFFIISKPAHPRQEFCKYVRPYHAQFASQWRNWPRGKF